ncbi:MAG: hypothetical protein V5A27_03205 [Halapricum sp.]
MAEYAHPWDHPESELTGDTTRVLTTLEQLLTGLSIGTADQYVYCTACRQAQYEGHAVTVYAYRCSEASSWDVARCYCEDCAPTVIETPTLGAGECLASATLGSRAFPSEQRHRLCLNDIATVALSPPTEGTSP